MNHWVILKSLQGQVVPGRENSGHCGAKRKKHNTVSGGFENGESPVEHGELWKMEEKARLRFREGIQSSRVS